MDEKVEQIKEGNEKNDFVKNFLAIFAISFATGFLAAAIVLKLYLAFVYHPYHPPKYYTFNLSKVLSKEEIKIMKNPKKDMKKEISEYMNSVSNYINRYSSNGIVFIAGATAGNSPYIQDITQGFLREWQIKESE